MARLREREVEGRILVSDGEIDNYLANPDQGGITSNVEVQTAHIVIRVPEQASPDQLMRIGARAQAALDQIRRGESFAEGSGQLFGCAGWSYRRRNGYASVDR